MPKSQTSWTEADYATAIAGFKAGLSHKQIADGMPGKTAFAVGAALRRKGCKRTPEERVARRQAGWEAANAAGRIGGWEHRKGKPGTPHRPEVIAKMRQIQQAMYACPERRRRQQEAMQAGWHKRDRAAIAAKISATKLAWCPEHLREEYRAIALCRKSSRVTAAEGRRMIMDKWRLQLARALRQIAEVAPQALAEQRRQHNSFEARLERVKAGTARVVPSWRPGSRPVDERGLIGSTMALL